MTKTQKKALSDCWDSLMCLYNTIPNKDKYALPYLVCPPENYFSSPFKVLVLGKETNGWGDKERCQWDKSNYKEELLKLYREVSSIFGKGLRSSFWGLVKNIANNKKTNVVAANVALIGYRYRDKGFNPDLTSVKKMRLADCLGLLYKALTPDLILLTIGSEIKNRDVQNYLKILKEANIVPNKCLKKINLKDITPKDKKRKIEIFEIESVKSKIKIFMTRHPQGCNYGAISNFITKEIENNLG